MKKFVFGFIIVALAGCVSVKIERHGAEFEHAIDGQQGPWTHTNFDNAEKKFTFAVFSDLTGGERERIFEIAIAQLNLLRPEFVINVGDLIEGGTVDPGEIGDQWDFFDARADSAIAPVFYVGGNHDLTGEVLQGAWDDRYGRRYYHFVYKKTLFMVLDTEDNTPERTQEIFEIRNAGIEVFNTQGKEAYAKTEYASLPERSSGNITAAQSEYFVDVIARHPNVLWTFLFMHKSPWEREGEESFAAIETALENRSYTVFNGHLHAYEHMERLGRDYIRLGTTGGEQFPEYPRSMDHVTLVTVDADGASIANLKMSGVLDKTGHVPLDGDDVCFEKADCGE